MGGYAVGTVVVLGASGYIGSTLVGHLAALGLPVRAVGRSAMPGFPPSVETVRADVTDAGNLPALVCDAEVIVHLVAHLDAERSWRVAADDPAADRVNVRPLLDLVEVLARRRPSGDRPPLVLAAGTCTQVGYPGHTRIDGTEPDDPLTPYDRTKLVAERALLEADAQGVLRAVPFRLPTVYGVTPATSSVGTGVVAAMVRQALAGHDLTLWHDGSVLRDLLHVEDVVRAFAKAIEFGTRDDSLRGRPWLLGTGKAATLSAVFAAIADTVATATGRAPVSVRSIPAPSHAMVTDLQGVEVDATPFSTLTGWRPRVELAQGLDSLVRKFRQGALT
jgi:nucleoside-diphosphate-sugar epimerase